MSKTAIEFKLDALAVLRGPGVYMYCEQDCALYIGASRKVAGRILARNHHIIKGLELSDSLLIFPCSTWQEAKELESQMIADLKPALNMRNGRYYRAKHISNALGTSLQHIVNTYISKQPA